MKRIFYIKDDGGEFVRIVIEPYKDPEEPGISKFRITSKPFSGTLDKNENGDINPPQQSNLFDHISFLIRKYYQDF